MTMIADTQVESEVGQLPRLDVNGHTVGIAVCRAWLTGIAPDAPIPAVVLVHGVCRKVLADLALLRGGR